MNTFEVEQKFWCDELAVVERRLAELGVRWQSPVEQIDSYYRHPVRDFVQTDEALRIRRVNDSNFVTYKGPRLDKITKTRLEIELPLSAGDEGAAGFNSLLRALGFQPVAQVRKRRRGGSLMWQGREVQVALDQLPDVGSFIELEMMAEQDSLEEAKRCIAALAAELKLHDHERRSYLELTLQPPV